MNWKSTKKKKKLWVQKLNKIEDQALTPFHYAICGVLENKTNVTSPQNIVGWILLHINLRRFFNAKSIFMQIVSSISNNSVKY